MVVLHATFLAKFSGLLSANTDPIYESLSNTHGRPSSLACVKVNVDPAQDRRPRRRSQVPAGHTVQELSGLARMKETEAAEAAEGAAKKAEANKKKTEAADVKEPSMMTVAVLHWDRREFNYQVFMIPIYFISFPCVWKRLGRFSPASI
ncbi:hypothetical protein CTA2_5930 [Colletotrichum tanaceti]|uniref:Uncharacterized protein n=1 Tax=Colletotrichum tanaceti TaxID=1306861 RepID=A0A4U6XID3_9PEZI|nr:hypothetical protein CTA2_5930 [Colletotrichum tanaceti]TKW55112.1 hypothetical protein CTA1_6989 [Colletotrichum tanaceti]